MLELSRRPLNNIQAKNIEPLWKLLYSYTSSEMIHHDLIPHFTRNFRDPGELYRACKEFDNYPGEGSYNLAALRAIKFYWLPLRQFFYEPLNSREQLKYIADVRYAL